MYNIDLVNVNNCFELKCLRRKLESYTGVHKKMDLFVSPYISIMGNNNVKMIPVPT